MSCDPVDDRPLLEGADDVELARPVHRVVDGRVGVDLGEARGDLGRVRHHAADVAVVEDLLGRVVLRRVGGAGLLVGEQRRLDVGGQLVAQLVRGLQPQRHRRGAVADREREDAGVVGQDDLRAEHPAPGLAEQVEAVGDPEVLDERAELGDEELDGPERRVGVGQVGAEPAAELVVVHDRAAVAGEGGHGQGVVVRRARPAVQDDERGGPVRGPSGSRVPVTRYQVSCPRKGIVPVVTGRVCDPTSRLLMFRISPRLVCGQRQSNTVKVWSQYLWTTRLVTVL